jgi:NAD(P)-dependent dehydrogenase (short-subunit alcohol dehydrogenase family)
VTSSKWGVDDIGDRTGTVALVTGANSGIGYATAFALAEHGAHVILACRNQDKARRALDELENDLERSSLELLTLDLSDLGSVRRAAEQFLAEHARLDLLINNAGLMAAPFSRTADGFELQMATNHFGHFALTGLLLPRLLASGRSRVVTVSSLMHRAGRMGTDDMAGPNARNTWRHYGTSKLANLLFTAELDRRLRSAGESTLAVAAHPGWTQSNLVGTGAALGQARLWPKVERASSRILAQATAVGALPTLYAATAPEVRSGQYFGPSGPFELAGPPRQVRSSKRARNRADAATLWERSEELTGVRYPLAVPAAR